MRKTIFYGALALASLVLLAVIGMTGWLLGTPEGARWLLDMAADSAGAKLEIGRLEGNLRHGLSLKGVTVRRPGIRVRIDEMAFDWRPAMLLTGNLAVNRLAVAGVEILDERPETEEPIDLAWPISSGPAARLNGWITSFTIRDLVYRRTARVPLTLSRLSARLDWLDGRVALTGLDLSSPDGRISGCAGISFREPELDLFATVSPALPTAGITRLLLLGQLSPARGKEHAKGKIRAVAVAASNRRFDLSGGIGISRNAISVREMVITETGRKGRLTGEGAVSFAAPLPAIGVRLKAEGLDLSPEVPSLPPISGILDLAGSLDRYRGGFRLSAADKGWRSASLTGVLSGNDTGMALTIEKGSWLGGTLGGALKAGWSRAITLSGELRGRGLDPARISPDWKGVVNLDLNGELRSIKGAPLHARVEGRLLSSRVRGKALTGELVARTDQGSLILDRLLLRGKGFDISASGDLGRRIGFALKADDLGGLVPGSAGTLRAEGEVLRRDGRFGGSVSGRAGGLKTASLRAGTATFSVSVGEARDRPVRVRLDTKDLEYGGIRTTAARLDGAGTLARHRLDLELRSTGADLRLTLNGGYGASTWQGEITRLSGRDGFGAWHMEKTAPLKLSAHDVSLRSLVLTGAAGERIEADGEANFSPAYGYLNARWQGLNLARAARWTGEGSISGSSSGSLSLSLPRGSWARISANAQFSGSATSGEHRVQVRSSSLRLETVGKELRVTAALDAAQDGKLRFSGAAPAPSGLTFPEQGTFEARLEEGNFRAIRPWLPAGFSLDGRLTARASGEWLPSRKLRLQGSTTVEKGTFAHQRKGGTLRADFRSASLSWDWRDETLGGSASIDLADTGRLRSDFRIPLPARFPAAVNQDGAVSLTLNGKMRENGVLTALFPGMIQESRGELELEASAAGTWRKPDLSGKVLLAKAGAYLPRAGVTLSDVRVAARLERDNVLVESYSARSGAGSLTGSATLRLQEWRPVEYRGTVRGDNFQFIYLPELQVVGSPRLDFTGTRDKISVRGDLTIPDLLVTGSRTPAPVRPSADVVVIDAPRVKDSPFPLAMDIQVRVLFGDRVFVKAEGIDARLAGNVNLTMRNPNNIRGRGEVRVVKGSYRAYGVNLEITKGRLVYVGGPVSRPNLDILALRTIGEVKAGIILGGTLQSPVIRLYSEPGMSDSDIMAYIVLGHPLSGDRGQIATVMSAAGLLLSAGQTAVLQDQIAGRFGLDTFGMEPDKSDVTKSLLTVGKYLTPKLFISYGRALFSPTSYVKARYTFSERWEVETWTGTESGVDLYYKINFD
jgi:translocation and assembly module TamB